MLYNYRRGCGFVKIVVTYFEPFGQRTDNVSGLIAKQLSYPSFCLSVGFNEVKEDLKKVFQEEPDLLVLFGEAGSYKQVTVEMAAHNLANGTDNYGTTKNNEAICDGPFELLTNVKLTNPAFHYGKDAGKYLCNYTYYLTLLQGCKAIFVHLPYFETVNEATILQEVNNIITYLKEENQ